MNREQKFLVELLADNFEFNERETENLDWQKFLENVKNQKLEPLIFQKLQPVSDSLPTDVFAALQNRAQIAAMKNLELNLQLIKLTKLFDNNDIKFIAYKGATLAQIAYGDANLRQFGDLDILIRKQDFPKVEKVILENGGKTAWNLSEKQRKAVLKYYYEFPFLFGENETLIEIHWTFMEKFFGFDLDVGEVFERSQTVEIHGAKIRTMAIEDLLILLCVHGSKHFWKRLSWICDVGKLLQNQQIDWQITTTRAEKIGCLRMLKLGLFLAQDLMKLELPDEIEFDKKTKSLAEVLKNQIFDKNFSAETIRTQIHLQMRERRRDKLRYSQRLFQTKLIDSIFLPMGRPQ